jgi:hypothetical protein
MPRPYSFTAGAPARYPRHVTESGAEYHLKSRIREGMRPRKTVYPAPLEGESAHEYAARFRKENFLTNPGAIRRTRVSRARYLARPSQLTRGRPSNRLRARRAVNLRSGQEGFFPNPAPANPRARRWQIVAGLRRGEPGTEYGVDAVTPVGWTVKYGPYNRREYSFFIPYEVTNSQGFGDWIGGAKEKYLADSLVNAKKILQDLSGFRKNPSLPVSSRARQSRRPVRELRAMLAHTRKVVRHNMRRPDVHYFVQVRRGNGWVSVAGFTAPGALGKKQAIAWAEVEAQRFPSKKYRVFWPDHTKKNPVARLTLDQWLKKYPKAYAEKSKQGWTQVFTNASYDSLQVIELYSLADYRVTGTGGGPSYFLARKNPAPRGDGARERAAAKLLQDFTGHAPRRARQVAVPGDPGAGLAVGPVLLIGYETTRDGKREKYVHEFRRGARPLLAASHDGRALYLLGGAYRFTERGIVDRKARAS